ncbi:CLUMA_CG015131, isoform A [Clunio marinus]|uniref:CLUMA_CG015131, isoform A n=1 Tax=Clunio marinus TaxID=568069 RepID=A0A1J1IP04_9DIPT|nr:CLUMA_CG015131, isoform A [Clunio marinus]
MDQNKENEDNEVQEKKETEMSNLKGDYGNVIILLFLYMLQGIPLGISSAVPILLQNRGVSYAEQAGFTFAFYPFTMKILWAPIVDSVYIKAFGRRKSWLVPTQILIGIFMIFLSQNVNDWLGDGSTKGPQMFLLTAVFFVLWFLTATQDVAVDGWALTMLRRENVGHAATCNAVGQTAGGFIGYVVFLILESTEFCNKYVFSEPRDQGLVTLSGFLRFWGVVFLGTTILIAIFKRESSHAERELEANPDYGVKKAYPLLWKIMTLKPIIRFSLVLLTAKASFAAVDAITTLKLIDYGMPKDKIALLSIPLVPLQILLPFIISRYTTGPYPMTFYIKAFPYRLLMTVVIAIFVYATPSMISGRLNDIPVYYYVAIVSLYMIYQVPLRAMYVADMAFMARISDPLVGGTYMTLLNTISNLGGRWVKTFFLWFVDIITWKSCIFDEASLSNSTMLLTDNKCENKDAKLECTNNGGKCRIDIDGYYIEVALNVVYGIIWYQWGKRVLHHLQNLERHEWHILSNRKRTEDIDGTPIEEIRIPLGVGQAIPMLLQNRGASYKQQAEFSFAYWPFSIKLLWAPIVDSLYIKAIGRRKSWMVPTQYLIGFFMLILSGHVSDWLGDGGELPRVSVITLIFFSLNFLAATQDIAVDGWALTMLKRCNVGHASTCNSVGQTAGYFLGYIVFMALESKEFCNTYIFSEPQNEGLVNLSGFLWFWGITFLVTTTLVGIFKREKEESQEYIEEHPDYDIKESYGMLWKIITMKPVMMLAAVLLTVKVSFAACDAVTTLKFIDHGIPKEKLALLAIPMVPLQILLPLIISKHTTGKYPMNLYIKAIPFRLLLTLGIAMLVWATPLILKGRTHDIPLYYYGMILIIFSLYQIFLYAMFCAAMAFFAKISDPRVGGTYMTLLNTLCNLGGNWPNTLFLWLVEIITWKSCVETGADNDFSAPMMNNNTCSDKSEQESCVKIGGSCRVDIDGYYIEVILCLIYGIIWYKWSKPKINHLQKLPIKNWHVQHLKTKTS